MTKRALPTLFPSLSGRVGSAGEAGASSGALGETLALASIDCSDGSTSTFSQSMSDWGAPERFAGGTTVETIAARISPIVEVEYVRVWQN